MFYRAIMLSLDGYSGYSFQKPFMEECTLNENKKPYMI